MRKLVNEFLNKEFFIIDSDNLDNIDTRLYGYAIADGKLCMDEPEGHEMLSKIGAYVFVSADENKIRISQDYLGSYGIYYYAKDNYFAISNSFLRLMEHLRDSNKEITLNRQYADYYMGVKLCSNLYSQTLVNEIEMLASNMDVIIDKQSHQIDFNISDRDEHSVPINSKEALDILDNWFYRWVDVIRNLRKTTNYIRFDLSGGIDSRLVAALWLNANIDLSNINITSTDNSKYNEDLQIASDIADFFGFKLNNRLFFETTPLSVEESLTMSEYVKFGSEKKEYVRYAVPNEPLFRISGHCGETLRDYINKTPKEYTDMTVRTISKLSPELKASGEALLNREFDELFSNSDIDDEQSKEISALLYSNGRNRHHFGKGFVDSFMFNKYTIAPLSDPDLQKINFKIGIDDNYLLIALILRRYCPRLLDFSFDSNRKISPLTLTACDEINSMKKFEEKQLDFIEGPEVKTVKTEDPIHKRGFEFIDDIFDSESFLKEFEKYFSTELYLKIRLNLIKNRNNRSDKISAIEIVKTSDDTNRINQNFYDWICNFKSDKADINQIKALNYMKIYSKARIDIKNKGGEDNAVEVIEHSDSKCNISYPKWLKSKEGSGCVLSSTNLSLDIKIKIIKDGQLVIKLRGPNVLDKNKNRFPVYIDYMKFSVNNDEILSENKLLSHDDGYIFKMDVKDSQVVDLSFEWMPFNDLSVYENKKITSLEKELAKLKSENQLLKDRLSDSKNSGLLSKLKKN